MSLRWGGTVDKLSFGIQHLRLYQVRKVALAMANGGMSVHDYLTARVMGEKSLVLRRKAGVTKRVRILYSSGVGC